MFPDIVGRFQQGQQLGTQQRLQREGEQQQSRLAALAQQAYGTQDASQRQGLIGQAVGVDPSAGFALGKQLGAQDDERTQRLVNSAKLLTSAPEGMRPALWQQVRGSIAQSGLIPEASLPMQYDDTVAQTAQALVQAYGGAQQGNNVQSRFVGEDGMIYALMRDGTTQPLGIRADPNTQIIEGAGGFYGVDKRNLQAAPVQIGGGQPQQPSREMPFTIDPSLPPEVQADIRATEASGQAWTQAPMGGGGQLQPAAPRVSPAEAERLRLAQEANERANRAEQRSIQAQAVGGKPPTEGERNAAGYYDRMLSAEGELGALVDAGFNPGNLRDFYTAGQGPALNWAATPEGQQYRQQQEDWVRAKLRKESGAVIGDDEMEREIRVYFPQPGDGPDVIRKKATSRQIAINAMRKSGGRAVQADGVGAQPARGRYQVGQVINVGGKQYRVTGGDPNDPDVEEL